MRYTIVATAALASMLLMVGCTTPGSSMPQNGLGASVAPSTPSTAPGQPGRTTVSWRGASINVAEGWRKAAGIDETEHLCLLRKGAADTVCQGDKVDDWLYLYASERSGGAEGEPAHPDTLDASGMNYFVYNGGVVPCAIAGEPVQRQKGTRDLGGRLAYYGEWKVQCVGQPTPWIAQRWVLPKSRLGVQSYALTEQSAEQIRQMITKMDLDSYQPTRPK